jgi:hypothetical protein
VKVLPRVVLVISRQDYDRIMKRQSALGALEGKISSYICSFYIPLRLVNPG